MLNSSPDYLVSSPTTNTFKARFDKFWKNQLKMFDKIGKLTLGLLFTGSRSKVELTID